MPSRRLIVAAGGGALASCLASRSWNAFAAEKTIAIHMKSDVQGAHVTFDPVGVFIEPGTTVRWVSDANVHTTTAYHPQNNQHCLRIPIEAQVWNSGYLLPKQAFAVTLTVEGVYDYFCIPHEHAGMVGRIIVGKATGPGAEPFDYFKGMPQAAKLAHCADARTKELSFDREHLERKGCPSSNQSELTRRDRFRHLTRQPSRSWRWYDVDTGRGIGLLRTK